MANSIAKITKYLPRILDAVYKYNALTSMFEAQARNVPGFENANVVKVKNIDLEGLGDYSRSTGYPSQDITISWTTHTLSAERGASMNLDSMDAEEAATDIQEISSEFVRRYVVPEIDQYRFKVMYDNAGTTTQTATPTAADIFENIDTAIEALIEAEADKANLVLFVSPTVYTLMKQSTDVTRQLVVQNNNGEVSRDIVMFDGIQVVQVPKNRFATGATFNDGSSTFGYTQSGYYINFILVDKTSIFAVKKHVAPKIIMPEVNQTYDGYSYYYRLYHGCFAHANRVNGIYVNYSNNSLT